MNTLIAANALGNSCQNRGKDASLTKSVDGFLDAVSKMRNTVMVPAMLKNVSYQDATQAHPNPPNQMVQAAGGRRASSSEVPNPDLLLCYKMVDAIGNDIVSGPVPKPNGNQADGAGEPEHEEDRFVGFFHQQVQGFINAMHQMTEMANLLTRKYSESIGGGGGNN